MSDQPTYQQLEMVWPQHLLNAPSSCAAPAGYTLRTYYSGDEHPFYELLTALKTSFTLGYVPYLYNADLPERWRIICEQINRPFTPDQWRQSVT